MYIAILASILFVNPVEKRLCCTGAIASTAPCPVCGLDVLKDSPEFDNKVVLEREGKKADYRCVLCAIVDAKADSRDLVITTPSEKKGKPVRLIRTAGKWTAEPETAVFAYVKGSHSQCEIRYRAITSKEEFDGYVAARPKILASAKLISLDEMIKRSE